MLTDSRRIAHLDMDAFYASVELLQRPELRDLPVAIGGNGDPSRRGVLTTANYVARQFGLRSGMPMRTALKLCPQAIFLPVDFAKYRHYSRLFKAAVVDIAPQMEDRGIDEIYLDLTDHTDGTRTSSRNMAQELKDAVLQATGLTCSIGVAPNKLIAKICSDLEKPNGLTIITAADFAARIAPLPVKKINGVGPKAAEKLATLGVETIEQLAKWPAHELIEQFGNAYGRWLHASAQGLDDRPVETYSEPKSCSRETTFDHDLHPVHDRVELAQVLRELCTKLAQDLARKQIVGRTIGIKLRFDDFKTVTRDVSLTEPTGAAADILRAARQCAQRAPLERKLRLIGVRVSELTPAADYQPIPQTGDLFSE